MAKNQNQNSIGIFRQARHNWGNVKYYAAMTSLAVVFVVGIVGGTVKLFHKSKPQVAADTQVTSSVLPNWWLKQYFGSSVCSEPNCQPDADPDHDGLTNAQEYFYHSNPLVVDTNGNSQSDGQDVAQNIDPSKPGKVTFDQETNDDTAFADGVLMNQDIQQLVADENNISNVKLPLVDDSALNLNQDTSTQAYSQYLSDLQNTVNKYFTTEEMTTLTAALSSPTDNSQIDSVTTKATLLVNDLKKISVPYKFSTFHKYNILLFQLLPQVMAQPTFDPTTGQATVDADAWYDKVQEFLAVQQKLDTEKQILAKQFGDTP